MKTIGHWLIFLGILLMMAVRTNAQTAESYKPSCDSETDKLVGAVSMSLGIDRVLTPTMSCLVAKWRDGKGGRTKFDVSNAFLSVLEANPRAFFSIMAKEPMVFEEWRGDLENLSFTWHFDPPCGLEETRKHLIVMLQHSDVGAGKPAALKNALIAKLSATRCRQIN